MPRYVLRDDHPYCIKVREKKPDESPTNVSSNAGCTTDGQLLQCYENVFANNCDECGKIIGIDSKDLSYKEKHWHEACFLCNKVNSKTIVDMVSKKTLQCRTSLVDKQFGSKADRIYCGPCYDAQFATRCDGCGDVFKAGEQMKCHIDFTSILVLQV